MSIEIGTTVNNFADKILKAPIVGSLLQNPVYTALLITLIIVILILWMFRDADTEDSLLTMSLRVGFWTFLLVTGVMFLHNRVLSSEVHDEKISNAFNGVFGADEPAPIHDKHVRMQMGDTLEGAVAIPIIPTIPADLTLL